MERAIRAEGHAADAVFLGFGGVPVGDFLIPAGRLGGEVGIEQSGL
ncbi:Uncharacterised protein [Mycobacteroides abscessus subsp. abscessus]|nr:Uncharacterised protein [Mycobacteroides abscessus subsp. abscessus]SKV20728.1 Uncharacterised protein [Mycobacteroides abscessus subsp. abscessus]